MAATSTTPASASPPVRGKIIEAEVKVSVDPGMPLPLVCALYAVENQEGVWLCAYYGSNRSVFDFLPQKGAEVDESQLGIALRSKRFVPTGQFDPAVWEEFKKNNFMAYSAHAG